MSKGDSQKTKRFGTNLILSCTMLLVAYMGIHYSHSQFVVLLVESVLITLSLLVIMNIKKDGLGPLAITALGCATLIMVGLIPNDVSSTQISDVLSFKTKTILETLSSVQDNIILFKEYVVLLSVFDFGIGIALAYRPNVLYVKNRLPDEIPYPVWESKNQSMTRFSPKLVSVKSLTTEKEKWIIFRYKFVYVSIDEKIYLVRPDDNVPETAVLLRSKSGQSLLGI
ncbi:MAG: hypothetical protein ACT4N5_00550 [Nitrosopumilaceae archaeon]